MCVCAVDGAKSCTPIRGNILYATTKEIDQSHVALCVKPKPSTVPFPPPVFFEVLIPQFSSFALHRRPNYLQK